MKNAPAYIKIYNRLKNEIQKGTGKKMALAIFVPPMSNAIVAMVL